MNDKTDPIDLGKPSGFRDIVGCRTTIWHEGFAQFEVDISPKHYNSSGFLHGGVYMTILDAAMGHASTWCSIEGNYRPCVTLTLTTSFVAAADTPLIRAAARLESVANRIAVCRGEVLDSNGEICLTGQGSYRYVKGGENVEGIPRDTTR